MSDSAIASKQIKFPPLWRNPSFTLMWTSTAASGFGDRMIMLAALALLGGIAQTADSAGILASTQFFFFLPYLIFNIFGGWLADHLPRKWLLLACDESRGMILLGSFFLLLSASGAAEQPEHLHWKVYAALAAIGTFAAIFNPTRNAIVPQIVPMRQLQSSNAIILVINVSASMVGMVVGTKLIINPQDVSTVRTGLMLGAMFYIVSGMFFAFMRPIHVIRAQTGNSRSLAQAARYASKHKRTITLILVNTMVWGSAAVVSTGVMGVLKIHYGMTGEVLFEKYGIVAALMGTGMLFGAAVVVIIGTRRESAIVLTFGLFMAGLCTLIFGAVPWLPVSYVSAFGVGLFGNIAIIAAITILQAICPNYIRGRIMGLNALVNTAFSVTVYGIIWQIPKADYWVLIIMLVLGPTLMAVGLTTMIRHLCSGPMPNKMANVFWRATRLFCFSWHGLAVYGKQHIPADGPAVIASNHTTAMDPFLIQSCSIRMVRWLMLTSYRLKIGNLMWEAIEPICIEHDLASDQRGSAMRQVRQIVGELKKGHLVGMFPEGALQYDSRKLKEFEEGAAVVARLSGAQIVPCWVDGTVVSRSMLMHVLKPTSSSITFGKPFTPAKSDSPEDITAEIRRRIIILSKQRKSHWCPECGYDQRGNPDADHCPECGHQVGAAETRPDRS
jgi:1-acyl-sn-glycerol-3-phosphate acyltransferase